jgi:predicted PurR-regulated permease PerM
MANKTPYTRPETYFFLIILILVGVLSFLVFMPFMTTLILASTFAVLIYPLHKKVLEAFRGNGGLASLVTVFGLVALIIIPLFLIAAQVFNETTSAYYHIASNDSNVSLTIDALQDSFNTKVEAVFPGVTVDLRNYITAASTWLLQNMGSFFSGTISIGLRLFLGLFALYYFIKDGHSFVKLIQEHSPIPREHTDVLIKKLRTSVRSIIGGSIVVALCQGIVSGVGYTIFGVPNPALWGTITALSALIPGVGTSIVLIPAVAYVFVAGSMWQGIGMGLWALTAVGLLDNFISPKIIGSGLKIHPLIVLFSIIGGLSFFGPEGFILGPLAISLFMALLDIYQLMVKKEEQALEEQS